MTKQMRKMIDRDVWGWTRHVGEDPFGLARPGDQIWTRGPGAGEWLYVGDDDSWVYSSEAETRTGQGEESLAYLLDSIYVAQILGVYPAALDDEEVVDIAVID